MRPNEFSDSWEKGTLVFQCFTRRSFERLLSAADGNPARYIPRLERRRTLLTAYQRWRWEAVRNDRTGRRKLCFDQWRLRGGMLARGRRMWNCLRAHDRERTLRHKMVV